MAQDEARIHLFIDLKGAQSSLGELTKDANKLRREIKSLDPTTKEFANSAKKLSEVEGRMKDLRDQTKGVGKEMSGMQKMMAGGIGMMAGFFAVDSIISFGKNMVKSTGEFQRFTAVLTNTLGSESDARAAMGELEDFAAATPFQLNELIGSYIKLVNQGFKPTMAEMTKMGDLASAMGKDFDQLTEAIIDAQTGEFERLKEFGIRAEKHGDQVAFTFKGIKTEVAFSADAIRQYVLSLGDAEGVAGGMAQVSGTLEGKLSNMNDAIEKLSRTFGDMFAPAITATVNMVNKFLESLTETVKFISNPMKYAREEANREWDNAVKEYSKKYQEFTAAERAAEEERIKDLVATNKNLTEAQLNEMRQRMQALGTIQITESKKVVTKKKELSKQELKDLEKLEKELQKIYDDFHKKTLNRQNQEVAEVEEKYAKLLELAHGDKAAIKRVEEAKAKEIGALKIKHHNEHQAEIKKMQDAMVEADLITEREFQEKMAEIRKEYLRKQMTEEERFKAELEDKYSSVESIATTEDQRIEIKKAKDEEYFAWKKETTQATEEEISNATMQVASDLAGQLLELWRINSQRKMESELNSINTEHNQKIRNLDREQKRESRNKNLTEAEKLAIEDRYDAQRAKLEKAQEIRIRDAKRRAFEREKRIATIQAIILGAQSVMQSLAAAPWPANLILAAGAAVTAGIQIGIIQSQPTPTFFEGGYTNDGPVYGRDKNGTLRGRPNYHQNEYVVPERLLHDPYVANTVGIIEAKRTGRTFAEGGATSDMANKQIASGTATGSAQLDELIRETRALKAIMASIPTSLKAHVVYGDMEEADQKVKTIRTKAGA